jgi:hypothetical protein
MPDDPAETREGDLRPVCLACLIDRHPEAGRGMDAAKHLGAARLVDGVWLEEELD